VGSGQTYTSLTNPGGLFQALNASGISGNTTVNITSDLTGETGAVALNQIAEVGAGGYTLTIKPSGAARTISGSAAALSMIKLNGADRVIFDGSLAGGTDRSLSLLYTNTGGTVVWIAAANASNGANNNTIKNCIIASNPGTMTVVGILGGSGVTLGGPAEAPNNNNSVLNNQIFRVQNSLYNQGNTTLDQNWNVSNNVFGSTVVADKNSFRGMLMGNAQSFTISGNVVSGVSSTPTTAAAMTGIQLAFNVSNGSIVNNRISDIRNNSATGTGAFGMQLSASPATNVTIANNFISDAITLGSATVVNNGHGINVNGAASAGAYKIYHNSINMNTNQTTGVTSALNVTSAVVAAGALDVRNNIFANTQTSGATRYGVFSAAAASVFGTINYNDYFAANVGNLGGIARVTLADWQAATGQDANSLAVDPLFISSSDLHLQSGSLLRNAGVAGTGITTDIDGDPRDATPDIGADETTFVAVPGSLQFSNATYSGSEAGSPFTVTVTRTGGSDGTVGVNYATSNGSATGGASCTPGVDYVNTSGTLTFGNGVTSQTFNVTICNDATDEPDETINYGLSVPTGGATIGTPSTATQTIVDDDASGTFAVNDVHVTEGNVGIVNATFTLTYTGLDAANASVQYSTANGTATGGIDYVGSSGTVTFGGPVASIGGVPTVTRSVSIGVVGGLTKEANETFFLNLSNPINGSIVDGHGVGIIIDDDRAYVADFDADRHADFSVYRPNENRWYVHRSTDGIPDVFDMGVAGDIPVPGDYDVDSKADDALWRPSTGQWIVRLSSSQVIETTVWGANGDKPVQGDYDGDGKTDLAIFRPLTGEWWIRRSSDGTSLVQTFGVATDKLVQGDYDGDFKTDIAVYRGGTWYILQSSNGSVRVQTWGVASDRPVSGDFDGDGSNDLAIYRDGQWWILNSLTGNSSVIAWGVASDIPAPADFDADGTTDIVVFRPSTGDWYVLRSSNGTITGEHWGFSGDIPVPKAYIPQ
jgi:Calx-beta domain-containing protein